MKNKWCPKPANASECDNEIKLNVVYNASCIDKSKTSSPHVDIKPKSICGTATIPASGSDRHLVCNLKILGMIFLINLFIDMHLI